jgi:NAD-dependent histone deacetylase SIR2
MDEGSQIHDLTPGETYQIDSDEYDSDDDGGQIAEEEYDDLVAEGMRFTSCYTLSRG